MKLRPINTKICNHCGSFNDSLNLSNSINYGRPKMNNANSFTSSKIITLNYQKNKQSSKITSLF